MKNDFIKVSKSLTGKDFNIEIYFSAINSTINIYLKESDFLNFLLKSGKLYNETSSSFKIRFSEDDFDKLISEKQREELQQVSRKIASKKRVETNVIIFVNDEHVPLEIAENLTKASGEFMEAMGFELKNEDEPVLGSFYKKLKYLFSSTIGEEDLTTLYDKGKKALELKYVELPTADQTEKLANAAEKLIKSLSNVEEGVIRCGGLIVLKKIINGKPKVIVQQLSTEMIIILDKNPKLLFSVNTIYELLTGDVKNDIDDKGAQEALIA